MIALKSQRFEVQDVYANARLLRSLLVLGRRLTSRFEELDRIAVWVFNLDLAAAWPRFHGVTKHHSSIPQRFDESG